MIAKPLRPLLLLAAMAFSAAQPLAAADSFHDSFDTFDSDVWGVNYSATPTYPDNVFRIQEIDEVNYLNLRRATQDDPLGGSANAFVYYKGTPDFIPGGETADFNLDLVIRIGEKGGASDSVGIAFRMDTTNYASTSKTGYYLGIDGSGSTARLALYKDPTNHTVSYTLTPVATSTLTGGLDLNVDYTLKLRVEGSLIEASLWKPNEDEAVASLTITDATYLEGGYFGLRTHFTNWGTSVYYRDLNVATIPEPATAALAGLALGGILLLKLRSRR